MGHKRYGYLPKSKIWRDIVNSLGGFTLGKTEVASITQNTLRNVRNQYSNLSNDPSINAGLEFLLHLSTAFKQNNPTKYLADKKLLETEDLTLLKLAKGASKYKQEEVLSREYQTFAKQALIDTVNGWYKKNIDRGNTLFSDEIDIKSVFSKSASAGGFTELSRMYFTKLTERYLKYFLEREASTKISNIYERERFSNQIDKQLNDISKHAFETTKITESFAAGWFNNYARDKFPTKNEVLHFLGTSINKMKSELLREEIK